MRQEAAPRRESELVNGGQSRSKQGRQLRAESRVQRQSQRKKTDGAVKQHEVKWRYQSDTLHSSRPPLLLSASAALRSSVRRHGVLLVLTLTDQSRRVDVLQRVGHSTMSFKLPSARTSLWLTRRSLSSQPYTATTCLLATSSFSLSPFSLPPVRHARVIVQKRAKEGLYAGKHIQFGNSVSHSHHKTRRTWQPNAQRVTLVSQLLQQSITLHATTHALRCIDKAGGLDAYIMGEDRRKLVGKSLQLRERMEDAHRPMRIKAEIEERLKRKAEKVAAQTGSEATIESASAQPATAAA